MRVNKIIKEEINKSIIKKETDNLSRNLEIKYGVDLFIYYSTIQHVLVISSIIVPKEKRNMGIGRKVMKEISNFADKHNLKILLTPTSEFGGNKKRLIQFYKSFGFEKNKDHRYRELMIREPNKSNKILKEEMGVSKFAEEILEVLERESFDIKFKEEKGPQIMVSDALIKIENRFFDMDLYVIFVDEKPSKYPIYNARLSADYANDEFEILLYLHSSFKETSTTEDIFNNEVIKSTLIHELHHLIRSSKMKRQKGFESKFEKTNPFLCYIFNIFEVKDKDKNKRIELRPNKWGQPSQELINLYYYLSKSELGSVIPEFKFYKNQKTIDMFKKIKPMSYPEFTKYIQNNHNGRSPTEGEYNGVMKRVRYFFNKIKKLGVSE